jgi:hypothetical protein
MSRMMMKLADDADVVIEMMISELISTHYQHSDELHYEAKMTMKMMKMQKMKLKMKEYLHSC